MKNEPDWLELYEEIFDKGVPYPKLATSEQMERFKNAIKYCVIHKKKFNPKEWGFGQEDENFRI